MQRKMKAAGTFSGSVATDEAVNYAIKSGGWKKAVKKKHDSAELLRKIQLKDKWKTNIAHLSQISQIPRI